MATTILTDPANPVDAAIAALQKRIDNLATLLSNPNFSRPEIIAHMELCQSQKARALAAALVAAGKQQGQLI
jgi:hypothetical protein